ncbi:MAG TPA: AMP-binding protein [Chloroflexota bacterium]|nr:AMP-binding protein [Chloroflexota bacterium]
MGASDALTEALTRWTGALHAPQERRRLAGAALATLARAAGDGPTLAPDRPLVCTAFDGTSVAAAVALMVLWARGYAPAPLDLRLGPSELAVRLRLVRPRVVLVGSQSESLVAAALAEARLADVRMVELGDEPTAWRGLPPAREAAAADPGLIVFTSGTSGTPKGVVLTRANLLACASAVAAAQRLTAADRALNALSLAHVNAPVVALLATVLAGGDLVQLRRFDPAQFWRLAAEEGVSWANLVPPLIATLARYPGARGDVTPAELRFVRSASAPLPVPVLAEFEGEFGVAVVESYGISEAASQVTINDPPPGRRVPGAVGTPRGVRLRLVDEQGGDVPPGQPGEVLVQGPSVMQGYLDDPAATDGALRGGWLHTGDVGVLDEAGVLRLVGRRTEIINRGGEKIPPRLVEEALLEHPAVVDAAAVGIPDAIYGEEIKAFVVLREGSDLRERELRAIASARLPLHARPRVWEIVAAIPRNAAGKIVRRALAGAGAASSELP